MQASCFQLQGILVTQIGGDSVVITNPLFQHALYGWHEFSAWVIS